METPEEDDKECLVCGKNVEGSRGFSHIKVGSRMIALCCPLCSEVYQKSPGRYAAKLGIRQLLSPSSLNPKAEEI